MTWLTDFFQLIVDLVPRMYHIPVNRGGILYGRNGKTKELLPGNRWFWPIIHSVATYPINRTTLKLPAQSLIDKEKQPWVLRGIISYEVEDVVFAFVETYEIEDVISDESLGVIADKFATKKGFQWTTLDLTNDITKLARSRLGKYGVKVLKFRIVEMAPAKVFRVIGNFTTMEDEE